MIITISAISTYRMCMEAIGESIDDLLCRINNSIYILILAVIVQNKLYKIVNLYSIY